MKKTALFTLLLLASTMILGSCVKKCKLAEESSDSGVIVQDVVIYPESGYLTSSMGGDYLVNASDSYADQFEVSFDGGASKSAVNYSAYNILGNPINVKCDASFKRSVTIDDVNQIVLYSIEVTECSTTCDEVRTTENYVLVPAFPSSYQVVYDVKVIEK